MISRDDVFLSEGDEPVTFKYDDILPKLPLPSLDDTLERYFDALKPFGTEEELKNSRKIIDNFKNGVGPQLHKVLVEREKVEKNWVEKWWEDYAYLTFRMPLIPYCSMVQPFISTVAGVEESAANSLKLAARLLHYNMIFWDLLRRERIRPTVINNGKVRLSSALYHRFYNTARIPGVEKDEIVCKFKTAREGPSYTHFVVIGNGRLFKIDALTKDNRLATPQQMWYNLKLVRAELDAQGHNEHSVPILTMDDRTGWAKNRLHLQELSKNNVDLLEIIESSLMVVCLDNNEPSNFTETTLNAFTGDFHSRWADKSGAYVFFKNGKVGCISEHSCYDATVSVQYSTFMQMSLFENPEPDWDEPVVEQFDYPTELRFDIDDHIKAEIQRMVEVGKETKTTLCAVFEQYQGYGKEFMKMNKIHPDAFVQTVLQLAYYKMHNQFVATYETAMMREYCNGRTETVRSCTLDSIKFCRAMLDAGESSANRYKLFKQAAITQNDQMTKARQGKGFDRHLFGLWCAATVNGHEVPDLYSDPLYAKSGGGGNFVLSTSTLGFSINNGYVAPMCLDGYGVFYSILGDVMWIAVTAYRDSIETSAPKFHKMFCNCFDEVKEMCEANLNQTKL